MALELGTDYIFSSSWADQVYDRCNTWLDDNHVVVSYSTGDYLYCKIGVISGLTVSFGDAYLVDDTKNNYWPVVEKISSSSFLLTYVNFQYYRKVRVCNISSETVISYGNNYSPTSSRTYSPSKMCYLGDNKFAIVYRADDVSGDPGVCAIGTISGTDISFGTEYIYKQVASSSGTYDNTVRKVNTNKIIIAYSFGGTTNSGNCIVGTISGTDISFGTEYVFRSGVFPGQPSLDTIQDDKFIISWKDQYNYPAAIVGTISGTDVSFGTRYVATSSPIMLTSVGTLNSLRGIITYNKQFPSPGYCGFLKEIKINGYVLTFNSEITLTDTTTIGCFLAIRNNFINIVLADQGNSGKGTMIIAESPTGSISPLTEYDTDYDVDFTGESSISPSINYDYSYETSLLGAGFISPSIEYDTDYDVDFIGAGYFIPVIDYDYDLETSLSGKYSISPTTNYDVDYDVDFIGAGYFSPVIDYDYSYETGLGWFKGKINRAVSSIVQNIYSKSHILKEYNKASSIVIIKENNSKISKEDNKKSIVQIEAHNNSRGN